jgi:hypothetical protein
MKFNIFKEVMAMKHKAMILFNKQMPMKHLTPSKKSQQAMMRLTLNHLALSLSTHKCESKHDNITELCYGNC